MTDLLVCLQVVLVLISCCGAQVYLPYRYGQVYPWAHQYRTQDVFGHTSFGHFTFDQNRQETRLADGRVVGQYSYIDPKGKPSVTFYDAGPQGFRVRSNNLPVAPTFDLEAPKPVKYTAEVAEAREAFQETFDEAASRKDREKRSAPFFTYPVSKTHDETKPFPLFYQSPYFPIPTYSTPYSPYSPFSPYSAPLHPFHYPHPYVVPSPEKKDAPVVTEARRRRDVDTVKIPFPSLYAQPTLVDHTFTTQQFDPSDAATPADTTKIELTTKEHKVSVPSVKYVHPYAAISPADHHIAYSAYTPGSALAYSAPLSPSFITYGSPYHFYNPFFVSPKPLKVQKNA